MSFYERYGFVYQDKPELPACGPENKMTRQKFWKELLCHDGSHSVGIMGSITLEAIVRRDIEHLGGNRNDESADEKMLQFAENL